VVLGRVSRDTAKGHRMVQDQVGEEAAVLPSLAHRSAQSRARPIGSVDSGWYSRMIFLEVPAVFSRGVAFEDPGELAGDVPPDAPPRSAPTSRVLEMGGCRALDRQPSLERSFDVLHPFRGPVAPKVQRQGMAALPVDPPNRHIHPGAVLV